MTLSSTPTSPSSTQPCPSVTQPPSTPPVWHAPERRRRRTRAAVDERRRRRTRVGVAGATQGEPAPRQAYAPPDAPIHLPNVVDCATAGAGGAGGLVGRTGRGGLGGTADLVSPCAGSGSRSAGPGSP